MKILIGKVLSNKMNKTAVVLISKYIKHPVYKKYITLSKKYHVHDEFNLSHKDDLVEIVPTKPFSKTKFWKIIKFLN